MAEKASGSALEIKTPNSHTIDKVHTLLKQGYDVELVKKDLEKQGYSEEIIEDIIHITDTKDAEIKGLRDPKTEAKGIEEHSKPSTEKGNLPPLIRREKRRESLSFGEKLFILLYSLLLFFFLIWVSIEAKASPAIVFACFLPTYITIIAAIALFKDDSTRMRIILWVVPLMVCIGFYLLGISAAVPLFTTVDIANVTVLNFIVSIVFIVFLDLFKQIDEAIIIPAEKRIERREDPRTRKTTKREGHWERDNSQEISIKTPKDISEYFQSIEDKAKALNFVIGRVYSNKHGGTPQIRDKIKIDKEWYNMFSGVTKDNFESQIPQLRDLVYAIGERLNVLWRTESEVFGITAVSKFRSIDHDKDGKDRVLDVLIRNDKDPVEAYYQTAVEFCNKAVQEIDNYKINLKAGVRDGR